MIAWRRSRWPNGTSRASPRRGRNWCGSRTRRTSRNGKRGHGSTSSSSKRSSPRLPFDGAPAFTRPGIACDLRTVDVDGNVLETYRADDDGGDGYISEIEIL